MEAGIIIVRTLASHETQNKQIETFRHNIFMKNGFCEFDFTVIHEWIFLWITSSKANLFTWMIE